MIKSLKPFIQHQEQDKDAHSHHFYLSQHWKPQTQQTRKGNKQHPNCKIGKETCQDLQMISTLQKTLVSTNKSLNEFKRVARYKINVQKSIAFLHSDNVLSEREIKKTTSFKNHIIKNKIPWNIFKDMEKLYSETYKT